MGVVEIWASRAENRVRLWAGCRCPVMGEEVGQQNNMFALTPLPGRGWRCFWLVKYGAHRQACRFDMCILAEHTYVGDFFGK